VEEANRSKNTTLLNYVMVVLMIPGIRNTAVVPAINMSTPGGLYWLLYSTKGSEIELTAKENVLRFTGEGLRLWII